MFFLSQEPEFVPHVGAVTGVCGGFAGMKVYF